MTEEEAVLATLDEYALNNDRLKHPAFHQGVALRMPKTEPLSIGPSPRPAHRCSPIFQRRGQ